MKTTVAINETTRIQAEPEQGGGVRLSIKGRAGLGFAWTELEAVTIKQDQIGALLFAIEQAYEAALPDLAEETAYLYPNGITA